MFIGLLLKNWQLVVITALLLTLAGTGVYVKVLKSNVAQCEAEKASLQVALDASQASVKSLMSAVEEQNLAVQKLKDSADEREKAGRAALAKAKATSEANKQWANDLLKRTIPQGVTACDAANQLINEVLKK
jgi:hypothetical protein